MTTDFESKLGKLREIYKQPEDQRLINDTERKIRDLISKADKMGDPIFLGMIADAKKKVREINFLLAYDAELNAPSEEARMKRYGLFRERSIHQFYLERFGVKSIEVELESLDRFMDEKLK